MAARFSTSRRGWTSAGRWTVLSETNPHFELECTPFLTESGSWRVEMIIRRVVGRRREEILMPVSLPFDEEHEAAEAARETGERWLRLNRPKNPGS